MDYTHIFEGRHSHNTIGTHFTSFITFSVLLYIFNDYAFFLPGMGEISDPDPSCIIAQNRIVISVLSAETRRPLPVKRNAVSLLKIL